MLEKPDLPDQLILDSLRDAYALRAARLEFLPLGADVNTAVYRVVADGGAAYFLKLRSGAFDALTVTLPRYLKSRGIQAIIAPLETQTGQAWTALGDFKLVLYPFIAGRDGYEAALSQRQWREFGAALRSVHTAQLPAALLDLLPRETFSAIWRDMVTGFQAQVEETNYADPVAARVAALMRGRHDTIHWLVSRAADLAARLSARPPQMTLCHCDVHAGNLLLAADGGLYIVDWDNPALAPKERDLSLIGGCPTWCDAHGVAAFYQGYGDAPIDRMALAYYRCERILADIAAFCQQLLATTTGGKDREQSWIYFSGQFLPNHEIDLAIQGDI